MRILLLTERFPPDIGGLARSAGRIAQSMADLGHDVHVLAFTRQLPPGQLQTFPAAGPASAETAQPANRPTVHRLGLFAAADTTLQLAAHILDHLHTTQPIDLVWGHYLHPAGFASVLFARSRQLPVIVSARGNDVDRLLYPPGDFARLQYTLQNADVITAVSQDLAQKIDLVRRPRPQPGAQPPDPVRLLPNVVNPDVFHPAPPSRDLRRKLGIADHETVLCFSGELRYKKGIDFLLGALPEVRRVRPACLLVIGQPRPEDQSRLADFSAQFPEAASRLIFTGHLESPADVAEHLRLADVYLQPSLWDGMPNALLEAMATALPCIASTAGGIPEVITHRETGLLLPVHALNRLPEAILELLAQPAATRTTLALNALHHVLTHFTPQQEHDRLADLLAGFN